MMFKTWEKIYWVIIGFFFVLACLPLFGLGEGKVDGKTFEEGASKGTYFGYLVLYLMVIPAILWVIIRLIVNKGWEDEKKKKVILL